MKEFIAQLAFISFVSVTSISDFFIAKSTLSHEFDPHLSTSRESFKSQHFNPLIEEFGFQVENYAYDYQGQMNVLNIDVMWRYIPNITESQYPDVIIIKNDLMMFMKNYPDKMKYWELLNKDVTQMLMTKYQSLESLRIKFSIAPNVQQPFARTCIVNLSRNQNLLNSR